MQLIHKAAFRKNGARGLGRGRLFSLALAALVVFLPTRRTARAQIEIVPEDPKDVLAVASLITAADFNGDRLADPVVLTAQNNRVSVLFSSPSGIFSQVDINVGHAANAVAVGDFTNDNHEDIAVYGAFPQGIGIPRGRGVTIIPGNGDLTFGKAYYAVVKKFNATSMAQGDFDQRNGEDLVLASQSAKKIAAMVNLGGTHGFADPTRCVLPAGGSPLQIVTADLNGDGLDDVLTLNRNSLGSDVAVFLNDPKSSNAPACSVHFDSPANYGVGRRAVSMAVADFNNDGALDVVVVSRSNDQGGQSGSYGNNYSFNNFSVSVLLNAKQCSGGTNGGGGCTAAADCPGGSCKGSGTFYSGPTVTAGCPANIDGVRYYCRPNAITAGDYNGDGAQDFAVTFFGGFGGTTGFLNSGSVVAFQGHADGTFDVGAEVPVGFNPQSMFSADFTGHGRFSGIAADDITVVEPWSRSIRLLRTFPPSASPEALTP